MTGLARIILALATLPWLAQAVDSEGQIPNRSYPANELFTQISPQLSNRSHNQPTVINGYLLLAGNGVHEFWDISDPYSPLLLSELFSPHRSGEAESHQVSFAKFPNGSLYLATTSGRGIDLWGIDNVYQPKLLSALELPHIDYGNVANAVWGIAWQGDYIYVGATTSGLYIVDAKDPAQPELVTTIPTGQLGGVAAGPLFALGNLLVITTPDMSAGVVTMDISDPADPTLLDFVTRPEVSYIGGFYGKNAHLLSPFETYDVTTDPRNIQRIGSFTTASGEYMSFANGHLFLGGLRRGSQGVWKYKIGGPNDLSLIGRIPGRDRRRDDQFSMPIGNLIAISDDQNVNGYVGSFIAVHATEPDNEPPVVDYVNPPDGAVDQAPSSRIALSFSDQIEFASVDSSTFIVRPIGGQALTGKWGHSQTVVTFWPDQPLQANTTYEVIAVADGITDLVGNALPNEFRSEFRTGAASPRARNGIVALTAVETGQNAELAAIPTSGIREYKWDFGDGQQGNGASVSHSYATPGRYTVTLSLVGPSGWDVFEAETATLSGGVVQDSTHPGYSGTGFADYPATTGSNVKVEWQIARNSAGYADIEVRYAHGGDADRNLQLVVNGEVVQLVVFKPTGAWENWQTVAIDNVSLDTGNNTLALTGQRSVGPNVDSLSLSSETSTVLASLTATQIVYQPLTANKPSRSSTVIVTADQGRAWTVNPDADTVTAVDTATLSKVFESSVGLRPRTLAQAPDGTIWVVNEGSHDISVLDPSNGALIDTIDLPYASMPYGIAFAPDGSAAYVSLQALGQLRRIDPGTRTVVHSLALGPDPSGIVPKLRGIAIDGDSSRILVTRFVSPEQGGEIYDVDVLGQTTSLARTIALAVDPGPDTPHGGRGVPNYISSLAISPDGVHVLVPSKKDNIERGVFRDGLAPTQDNAVRTIVSRIDLSSGREDLAARIDLNDHNMAFAVAFSPLGDLVFTAVQGSNLINVIDAHSGTQVAGIPTGLAPQGLTLDGHGRLYVQNFMSRSLSVFDVAALLTGAESSAGLLAEIDLVANETLPAEVLLGKQIFHDASSKNMTLEGYVSCASCHLDGGQDGRTWDFTDRGEGIRNTISLQGRGGTLLQGPVHWTGNFDEIQDFENDIRSHFGGIGFMSDDDFNSGTRSDPLGDPKAGLSRELDALAAYVSSLTSVPLSPYRRADGSLTAEGELGKQMFANLRCGECHGGAEFTDSALGVLHDVGTISSASGGRMGGLLAGFDTPTLKGVWATAPYLHDGSAATLAQAIEAHRDVAVSSSEINALVSYVQQIDGLEAPISAEATFVVSVEPETISEGESATLTVAISNGVTYAEAQTIALATSGTASATDYSGVPATVTLAAGTSSVTATLAAAADEVEEEAETLTLTASHGGASIGSATVTIESVSRDATLGALSLSGVDIGTFSGAVTSYQASVANAVATTSVTATAAHSGATVSIEPGTGVTLAVGANEIAVTVTAEDGTTKQTYTVTVTRAALPVATIAEGTTPVTEGAAATFTVRLDQPAPEPLSVSVAVAETGSALSGTPPASVAFAKDATSATLQVPTAADSVAEPDSVVTATLTEGTGYSVGSSSSAAVTVEDDDTATFTVTAVPEAIGEGETSTLTVAITNGVTFAQAQTISVATSGTASASDYTGVPATLTLAAGASSVTATLAAVADEEEEEAETVTLTASHGGASIGSATVTIESVSRDAALSGLSLSGVDIGTFSGATTDYQARVAHSVTATEVTATAAHPAATVTVEPGAEVALAEGANEIRVRVTAEDGTTTKTYAVTVTRAGLPVVSIAAVASPVAEGEQAKFRVSLSEPATERLRVAIRWAYSDRSESEVRHTQIAPGATSNTPSESKGNDNVVREDLTVTLTLEDGEGYRVSEDASSAAVTVQDDDAATFTVSAEPEAIAEAETATLTVAISNGVTFAEAQTISLATTGSASASDYTGLPATLTLAAGASSVTAELAASMDQEEEEAETVTVEASHGGSSIGSATVTIESVSRDAALSGLSLSGVDIGTFSGATTDYQARVAHSVTATEVTATAAHPAATVTVEPGAEVALAEGANEIRVRVTAEDGTTTKTYAVTVTRAGLPVVSIAAVASPVAEGEQAKFRVSLSEPATESLRVAIRWAYSDRSESEVRHTQIAPGATSNTPSESKGNDNVVREDLTVTLTLEDGEGYRVSEDASSAAVTVQDDDAATFTVSAEPEAIAEAETATLTVAISNGVTFAEAQTISLATTGSASASDHTGLPATLTLAAGASSVTAELTASVDQEEEEAEAVTVEASHGGSSIGSATVTIESVSRDAALSGLSLSGVDIGTFSSEKTAYRASVPHDTFSTEVTATAAHSAATVTVEPGAEVALAEGANEIRVRVMAEDGTTTKTYTVTVTRAGLPVVSIAAVASPVAEGERAKFTVSRTGPTTEPLTVNTRWAYSDRRETRERPLLFQAGLGSKHPSLQRQDDSVVREDVVVTITLEEGEGYTVAPQSRSAEVVLEDNDVAEFAVSVEPDQIAEGESATVRVRTTNGVTFEEDQAITLDFAGSTAAEGTDFSIAPGSLTLRGGRIEGATFVTATLTATQDAEGEQDETVSVAARHGGATIGTATLTITNRESSPLTAAFAGLPATHDGEAAFTFELSFSEEVEISDETLRETAFEVTAGSVTRARRLSPPSNLRWEIHVEPLSEADVALALPATTDCKAAGAVCTAGGKALSGRLAATVKGPGSEPAGEGFSLARENTRPSGIWSDGQTAWVADLDDARLYAYSREDGERQPGKDIATEAAPMGLWSDGETVWVAGLGGGLRAHRLANGARLAGRDLALKANAAPAGVWSDGETAWVADWLGDTVHAYRLADGRREAERDIRLDGGNLLPVGLWSDGQTLWVADWRERMYAYRLSDGGRDRRRDIDAGAGDADPTGLWSGNGTLFATSWEGGRVRAYRLPEPLSAASESGTGNGVGLPARAASLPPIADAALRAALRAALHKAPGEEVSPRELAELGALTARNAGIRDLSGLEQAVSLKELDLGFNPLADLRPLAALRALEALSLDGAATDLEALAPLAGLQRLSLRHNGIDDLWPLAGLASLAELDVGDNRIADLQPLAGLGNLAVLRADRNRIEDLWPLASLAGLEVLDVGVNRVRDLRPLAGLARLQTLRLGGNGLAELHPLSGLRKLQDLGLAGNAVEDLRALSDLVGLRRLDLRGNPAGDLRPLRPLESLAWVHVGGSRIEDLAPLDGLPGLIVRGRDDRESPGVRR